MQTTDNRIVLDLAHGNGNPRNSEGSFVTLTDGRIMFAWSRYRGGSWADEARADIAARVSSDGGNTWSEEDRVIVEDEGGQNVMSASLLRLQDGRIALFYLRKNSRSDCCPRMRLSDDEGETWSDSVLCAAFPGYFCLLNDQAIQLASGRIILPVSCHPEVPEGSASAPNGNTIVCFLSDDRGRTWRAAPSRWAPESRKEHVVAEPGIVERPGGSLYCYARTGLHRQWESTSQDQGETWALPRPSRFRSPTAPMNIKRIPQSGDLLAAWNDLTPRWGLPKKKLTNGWIHDSSWGRTPLVVAISKDEGRSWRHAKAIETDPTRGFCYPAIHFTEDAALLAYCCGGGGQSAVLQDLCIRRVTMDWLYG